MPLFDFCSLCFGYLLLLVGSKEGRKTSVGACPRLVSERYGGEISPPSFKLSIVFTLTNEGLRMYIPIGISSLVGERATAHIPETPRSLRALLVNSTVAGFTRPIGPTAILCWVGGKPLDPHPAGHMASRAPPLSFSGVRLFLLVTVIVSPVTRRPSCPGLSARGQCPLQ